MLCCGVNPLHFLLNIRFRLTSAAPAVRVGEWGNLIKIHRLYLYVGVGKTLHHLVMYLNVTYHVENTICTSTIICKRKWNKMKPSRSLRSWFAMVTYQKIKIHKLLLELQWVVCSNTLILRCKISCIYTAYTVV